MINRVTLVGNVGQEPEIRTTPQGVKIARVRLATTEKTKSEGGEWKEFTEWHTLTMWRGLAEIVERYVHKGSLLYCEGTIHYRSFEKDGKTSYFTEIECQQMKMLSKDKSSQTEQTPMPESEF